MRVKSILPGNVMAACIQTVSAQGMDVKGTVRDTKGNPVVGASITVKGQKALAMTDIHGQFFLKNVNPADVLVVSYIGMERQEVKARRNLTVSLADNDTQLNEVMVVAFGKQQRRRGL